MTNGKTTNTIALVRTRPFIAPPVITPDRYMSIFSQYFAHEFYQLNGDPILHPAALLSSLNSFQGKSITNNSPDTIGSKLCTKVHV
jgi:hypothetical protein